jgi:Zn finger protein HypA/HybF involved in hydrogenase expression
MERFPRGSLPPYAFNAVATVAPVAVAREAPDPAEPAAVSDAAEPAPVCDLTTTCPTCMVEMQPEHAHYKCPSCGYRDSCCF